MEHSQFALKAQDRFVKDLSFEVRKLLDESINRTSCFIDERPGIGGGKEFRVLTLAHGECLGAIRVERC